MKHKHLFYAFLIIQYIGLIIEITIKKMHISWGYIGIIPVIGIIYYCEKLEMKEKTRGNKIKKISKKEIDNALNDRYPISNMDELGFSHQLLDGGESIFRRDETVVIFNPNRKTFSCYKK